MSYPQTRPTSNLQTSFKLGPYAQAAQSVTGSVIIWGSTGTGLVRAHRLTRVWYNNPTGFVQSDSAYWVITVTDGTNILASYSTKTTGGQGTLTANTPVEFVINTAMRDLGQQKNLTLTFTATGSPASLPAGTFVLDFNTL